MSVRLLIVKILVMAYGVASYMMFLVAFLYMVGFVGNWLVPKSVDSGTAGPVGYAVLVDGVLIVLFAMAHSIMARPAFKRWWLKFVPPPIERSTYVLISSLLLGLLFWQWLPIPTVVWHVENQLVRWIVIVGFSLGWTIVLLSTYFIDHFELFGLRQVYSFAAGRPDRTIDFKTPGLYRYVRHPLMTGFIVAFWTATTMSVGHLFFALVTTAYILIALQFEEQDLERSLGEPYRAYRQRAGLLLPKLRKK